MQIWNFRGKNLMEENRLLMEQVTEEDINIKMEPDRIAPSERQWIQVEKAVNNDNSIYVEKEALKQEMDQWKFPLHFIDFETSTVALPFTAGRRPYEQVAFQFSHHKYNQDGSIEHQSQYINNTPGEFPNFIFARALQAAIGKDEGTIFKFATHENSIVNAIITQLEESNEEDKNELIAFLKTISIATKNQAQHWEGDRNMVDLCKVVKDYYYNPITKGSNSIKAVLPAALTAYAKLQYVDMNQKERDELTNGLLKYCELDTLAMVMIYEHFRFDIINN